MTSRLPKAIPLFLPAPCIPALAKRQGRPGAAASGHAAARTAWRAAAGLQTANAPQPFHPSTPGLFASHLTMLALRLSAPAGQAVRASSARASCVARTGGFAAPARSLTAQPASRRARLASTVVAASAAASAAVGNATAELSDAFTRLAGVKPYLVSSQQPVELTGLWGADERAVVFFARHMVRVEGSSGWMGSGLGEHHRRVLHTGRAAPPCPPPPTGLTVLLGAGQMSRA